MAALQPLDQYLLLLVPPKLVFSISDFRSPYLANEVWRIAISHLQGTRTNSTHYSSSACTLSSRYALRQTVLVTRKHMNPLYVTPLTAFS
jgi:hypothetical protein